MAQQSHSPRRHTCFWEGCGHRGSAEISKNKTKATHQGKHARASMASRISCAALRIVRRLLSQDARDMDTCRECDICRCDLAICELDLEAAAANGDPVVTELQEELDSLQAHFETLVATLKTIGALARVR